MTRQGHEDILRLLLEELTTAHTANQSARLRFDFIVKQASLGMPQHYESPALQKAGTEFQASLGSYIRALKRYTAFAVRRIVPEDTSRPED